jgi:hypothetical protein
MRTLRRCALLFILAGLAIQPGILFPSGVSAAAPQTAAKNRKKAKRKVHKVKQAKREKILKGRHSKHHPKPA